MTREEAKIFLLQLHTDKQLNKSEHEALRIAVKALEQEPCREADDYENEISDLYNRLDIAEYDKERLREEVTTLEEKLKGLSAEPCEDAISRAEVIDELNRIGRNAFKEDTDYDNFFAFLDNLPPVTPKPKTGHWYIDERPESDRETICSNCEQPIFKYHKLDFDYRPKYCPNCGVKMIEPQESEGINMWLCKRDLSKECEGKYRDCTDCVLDKIRAEIERQDFSHHDGSNHWYMTPPEVVNIVVGIIDKYKAEFEPQESEG